MVLNPEKCCYMTFGSNTTKNEFVLEDSISRSTYYCTVSTQLYLILEITIDFHLTFY